MTYFKFSGQSTVPPEMDASQAKRKELGVLFARVRGKGTVKSLNIVFIKWNTLIFIFLCLMQNKKQPDTDKHARNDTSNFSLSLLLGMSDIPLYRAAEKLGISTSYLKNICRRLGIARWPRAGRSIGGVSKSNPQAKVNIDYSRRIYRKYSAGAERKLPLQINIGGNSEERIDLSLNLHDQQPHADPDFAEQGSSTHSPAWTWDIGWNPQQELSTEQTSWDS